jgi:hypothetical protein
MKAAYRWLNEVTFNSYVHTVRWTALGAARVVIGTVPFYLFFCRDSALCSASTASETMGTIPKNLRARLTQIARTMEEGGLSGYLVAIQVIVRILWNLDQPPDSLY